MYDTVVYYLTLQILLGQALVSHPRLHGFQYHRLNFHYPKILTGTSVFAF